MITHPIISLHHASQQKLNEIKVDQAASEIEKNTELKGQLQEFTATSEKWSVKELRKFFSLHVEQGLRRKKKMAYLYLRAMTKIGMFSQSEDKWPVAEPKTFRNPVFRTMRRQYKCQPNETVRYKQTKKGRTRKLKTKEAFYNQT